MKKVPNIDLRKFDKNFPKFSLKPRLAFLTYFIIELLFFSQNVIAQQRNPMLPPCVPFPRTPCLLVNFPCTTSPVVPFNEPYIWNSNEASNQLSCEIGIQRLLARPAEAQWLGDFIRQQDCNGAPINPNSSSNCTEPYDACNTNYCPQKYCDLIKFFVDSDISFLGRVYKAGYHEFEIYPCFDYYRVGRQLVDDINFAYDCKGKMRPVIQAFMGEVISEQNFLLSFNQDIGEMVTLRRIPPELISLYFDYYGEDELTECFADPDLTNEEYYAGSQNRYFTATNMFTGHQLDISRVEARMWFLYQAITFIDMGYTAIHMGVYTLYARSGPNGNDPGYDHLYHLTNNIRDYASGSRAGFVLLSGETPYENIDNGLSAKWGNTEQLIFDFDSRAMRVREIGLDPNGNPISGDGDIDESEGGPGCDQPINPADLLAFNNSPCSTETFPAVVDPCTINSAGGTSGGISPLGCTYEQVPYLVHWDGNPGMETNNTCSSPCSGCVYAGDVASNGPVSLTWGYDDNRWFGQPSGNSEAGNPDGLSSECRSWWFDHFFCSRRSYHGGNGFIMVPATLILHYNENCTHPTDGNYLIIDDTAFVSKIKNSTLGVKLPTIEIKEFCVYEECDHVCNDIFINPHSDLTWKVGSRYYMLTVGQKDCSSIYSFHIKRPDNIWLDPQVSDTIYLWPPIDGNYEITLRQDNLGISPPSSYGTREVILNTPLKKECCELIPATECNYPVFLTTNCRSNDSKTSVYDFQVSHLNPNGLIMDLQTLNPNNRILNLQNISTNSIIGRVQVKNTPYPKIDFMVKYYQNWPSANFDTIRLLRYPTPCLAPRSQDVLESALPIISGLEIIPNPANDYVDLVYTSLKDEFGAISVFNALGQAFSIEKQSFKIGENRFHLNIVEWPSGVYFALVTSNGRLSKGKIIKRD